MGLLLELLQLSLLVPQLDLRCYEVPSRHRVLDIRLPVPANTNRTNVLATMDPDRVRLKVGGGLTDKPSGRWSSWKTLLALFPVGLQMLFPPRPLNVIHFYSKLSRAFRRLYGNGSLSFTGAN